MPYRVPRSSFRKAIWKTKYDVLNLSGADVCARSLDVDSFFRINIYPFRTLTFLWDISFKNEI